MANKNIRVSDAELIERGLPEMCWGLDRINNNCIIIKRGESGYYKTNYPEGKYTDEIIDELNIQMGVSKAQRMAMETGSMFGWNAGGANPKAYEGRF